jgi:hypothetical protein
VLSQGWTGSDRANRETSIGRLPVACRAINGVALLGLTQLIYWALKPALMEIDRRTG